MFNWDPRKFVTSNFSELLIKLKEDALKRDLDLFIVNSGNEGVGKSNLSLIEAFLLDENFDFSTMYLNKYDVATRMIDKLIDSIQNNKFYVHLIDEGQNVLSRKESRSKFSALFDQLIKTIRVANNIFVVNTPDLSGVDISLQRRADIITYIDKRGHGYLWVDDEFMRKTKMISYIEQMRKTSIYFTLATDLDTVLQKFPPFLEFRFKRVPDKIFEEYQKFKKMYTIDFLQYIRDEMLKYLNKKDTESKDNSEQFYTVENVAEILNVPVPVLLDVLSLHNFRKTKFTEEDVKIIRGWLNE